jgi:hypothetical protein
MSIISQSLQNSEHIIQFLRFFLKLLCNQLCIYTKTIIHLSLCEHPGIYNKLVIIYRYSTSPFSPVCNIIYIDQTKTPRRACEISIAQHKFSSDLRGVVFLFFQVYLVVSNNFRAKITRCDYINKIPTRNHLAFFNFLFVNSENSIRCRRNYNYCTI